MEGTADEEEDEGYAWWGEWGTCARHLPSTTQPSVTEEEAAPEELRAFSLEVGVNLGHRGEYHATLSGVHMVVGSFKFLVLAFVRLTLEDFFLFSLQFSF
jgi:hypothetical protein